VIFEVRDVKTSHSNRPVAVVLMSGVLHYIDTLAEALPGMLTLRKPDGWWVAHEPHPGTPRMRLAPVVRKRLDPHYASDHQERSAADLRHLYGRAGLVDMRMVPQGLLATPCAEVICSHRLSRRGWQRVLVALMQGWSASWAGLQPLTWHVLAAGRKPHESCERLSGHPAATSCLAQAASLR
jgi:hypothetical protein